MGKNISLDRLTSFGDVAAEDDAVLDYFLKTDAVSRIQTGEVFLVLGRKGSGKTALVRYFVEGQWQDSSKSLNLRGYPWNIHAQRVDKGASEIEAYVSSWRYLIAVQLASLSLSKNPSTRTPQGKSIRKYLEQNYGGTAPLLSDVLRPSKLHLSNLSFEPEVLGCKLGGIALERKSGDLGLGLELNALSDLLIEAAVGLGAENGLSALFLHVDELDQGLSSMTEERTRMLIGLILAARSVRHFCKETSISVTPVVYLRTDLWDELKFSDKNKISETLTLHLEWDSKSLLDLTNTRLRARLSTEADWDSVSTPKLMRGSQTKWNHILSRTFLRPRDVIKFLNAALGEAKKREDRPLLLDNRDIINAREQYSAYLKSELDDEIIAHWPQWEEALQACSAISTLTFERDKFTEEYERRRSTSNGNGVNDALKMLYRFSVIGYERRSGFGGSSWAFQYTSPEAGWDNGSSTFKVHQGLKEFAKLREERL
jgi:hypothetical protein